ncbi:MAG: hypothetical protein J0H63_13515 [Rhizobiales bacterium]|nr:hypothetical protein [Hyphomicrobiales bacterium]
MVRLLAEANPSVEGFPGSIGDGCGARVAGFASADPTAILVPDPYFFNTRGYDGERRLGAADTGAWRERSGDIIWRGAPNGVGSCTSARMSPDDPDLIQRTRLCLILKGMAGVDAAFVDAAMATIKPGDAAALAGAGIVGSWIRTAEWKQRRFAIDVDGNTSAWSNLFHRLLLGCCVIKVGSQHGFRQPPRRGVVLGDVNLCLPNFAVQLLCNVIEVLAHAVAHPCECVIGAGIEWLPKT